MKVNENFIPRYYQIEAHNAAMDFLAKESGNPLIGLPTGTGKSIVIAMLIYTIVSYPYSRVMCVTHVKELLTQNAAALEVVSKDIRFGYHCSGLRKKDCHSDVIFASVQTARKTVQKTPNAFGNIDILIIDEAHLVNTEDNTNYKVLIDALRMSNRNIRIIGLTATPFRMKNGSLIDSGMFTAFCYNRTSYKEFNEFVEQGFLSLLIAKRTDTLIDVSKVKSTGSDFNQHDLARVSDNDKLNVAICQELVRDGADRQFWLIFCAGIKHAEHIEAILSTMGIDCAVVHSEKSSDYNDATIRAFKAGKLRALINADMLTTGFDCPQVDMIGVLRATLSCVKHVQMLGRGTRPSPETGKVNCLVKDFAGNIKRLGPINDPVIPRKKGEGPSQPAPIKVCPQCGVFNHTSARTCVACGTEFPINMKLRQSSYDVSPVKGYNSEVITDRYQVSSVIYDKIKGKTSPGFCLKITYSVVGELHNKLISEYIFIENPNRYTQFLARTWWQQVTRKTANEHGHFHIPMPKSVDEVLQFKDFLNCPKYIVAERESGQKFYKIIERVFE